MKHTLKVMKKERKSKEETVAEYIDAFLADRTPEQREKFLAKSIDKQYNSISQWRRRNGEKNDNGTLGLPEMTAIARGLARSIESTPELTEKDIARLRAEIMKSVELLDNYHLIQTQFNIKETERQLREMKRQEEKLRNQREATERQLQEMKATIQG